VTALASTRQQARTRHSFPSHRTRRACICRYADDTSRVMPQMVYGASAGPGRCATTVRSAQVVIQSSERYAVTRNPQVCPARTVPSSPSCTGWLGAEAHCGVLAVSNLPGGTTHFARSATGLAGHAAGVLLGLWRARGRAGPAPALQHERHKPVRARRVQPRRPCAVWHGPCGSHVGVASDMHVPDPCTATRQGLVHLRDGPPAHTSITCLTHSMDTYPTPIPTPTPSLCHAGRM